MGCGGSSRTWLILAVVAVVVFLVYHARRGAGMRKTRTFHKTVDQELASIREGMISMSESVGDPRIAELARLVAPRAPPRQLDLAASKLRRLAMRVTADDVRFEMVGMAAVLEDIADDLADLARASGRAVEEYEHPSVHSAGGGYANSGAGYEGDSVFSMMGWPDVDDDQTGDPWAPAPDAAGPEEPRPSKSLPLDQRMTMQQRRVDLANSYASTDSSNSAAGPSRMVWLHARRPGNDRHYEHFRFGVGGSGGRGGRGGRGRGGGRGGRGGRGRGWPGGRASRAPWPRWNARAPPPAWWWRWRQGPVQWRWYAPFRFYRPWYAL